MFRTIKKIALYLCRGSVILAGRPEGVSDADGVGDAGGRGGGFEDLDGVGRGGVTLGPGGTELSVGIGGFDAAVKVGERSSVEEGGRATSG